jgi:hypothetical protein
MRRLVMNNAMRPVLSGYLKSNPIKTDASTGVGGRQGGVLTGSIFARVPTALIEMCYINQKKDAQFIASPLGRERMAQALETGVLAWREVWKVRGGIDLPRPSFVRRGGLRAIPMRFRQRVEVTA